MSIETSNSSLNIIDIKSLEKKTLEKQLEELKNIVMDSKVSSPDKIKQVDEALNKANTLLKTLDSTQETKEKTVLLEHVARLTQIKKEIEGWTVSATSFDKEIPAVIAGIAFFAPELAEKLNVAYTNIKDFFWKFFWKKTDSVKNPPAPTVVTYDPPSSLENPPSTNTKIPLPSRFKDNQIFYNYANQLHAKNIGYKLWSKNSKTGKLDCSGFVCETLRQATGIPQPIKQVIQWGATSEWLIAMIDKKNKTGRKNKNLSEMTLKEGMIVSVDTGKTKSNFDAGRKWWIDHTALILRDPITNQLMVSESVSSKGVRTISLEQREKNMKNAGNRKGASTTFFTVDPYQSQVA